MDGVRGIAQLVERRSPKPKVVGSMPTAPANEKERKMKTTPAQFVRQVKQEISKITWPSRSETMQGTVIVVIMSLVLAIFLLAVDTVFAKAVKIIVGG